MSGDWRRQCWFILLLVCTTAAAEAPEVKGAWARATPPGIDAAAVYMQIVATRADTLLKIETPVATRAEMHETSQDLGVMKMRPIATLAVAAGKVVLFEPVGKHVMLSGLHRPLTSGARFPLTLHFQASGTRTVEVAVLAPDAMSPHGASR
jgi:copper(I)-binding protein